MDIFSNYSLRIGFGYFFFIYTLNINLTVLGKDFKPLPSMLNQGHDWYEALPHLIKPKPGCYIAQFQGLPFIFYSRPIPLWSSSLYLVSQV